MLHALDVEHYSAEEAEFAIFGEQGEAIVGKNPQFL